MVDAPGPIAQAVLHALDRKPPSKPFGGSLYQVVINKVRTAYKFEVWYDTVWDDACSVHVQPYPAVLKQAVFCLRYFFSPDTHAR